MPLYTRIVDGVSSLVGRENHKTPEDRAFEQAVLADPSKTHIDITSNDVHRTAVQYNKGMNMQALLRNEVSHYLSWGAVGIFSAALGAGAIGQLGTFVTAITSTGGLALLATAVALSAAAIYIKVNNTKIQSEKNMNLGEFEMRRGAKIMAQELAREIRKDPPAASTQDLPYATRRWVEQVQAQSENAQITSQRLQ